MDAIPNEPVDENDEHYYFAVPLNLPPAKRFGRSQRTPSAAPSIPAEACFEIPASVVLDSGIQDNVLGAPSPLTEAGTKGLPRMGLNFAKSLSHLDLKALVRDAPGEIVAGLIPEGSVNIAVGDSGLGKTPLLIQLGICVAAGIPFLNQAVRRGPVILVDYENGLSGLDALLDTLAEHLGLESIPEDFRILSQPISTTHVFDEMKARKPSLVIVDALRGFDSRAERDNTAAGAMLSDLQKRCSELGSALLFVHHIRKQDVENPFPLVDSDSSLTWLLQASGARALINQTAVRIGIDKPAQGPGELVIRGHYKLRGEIGPWQIARKHDETGEPIGYYRLSGVQLLAKDQQEKFALLPTEFTFGEAERIYAKKGGKPTAQFLKRCQAAGILAKHGKGKQTRYRKTEGGTPEVK